MYFAAGGTPSLPRALRTAGVEVRHAFAMWLSGRVGSRMISNSRRAHELSFWRSAAGGVIGEMGDARLGGALAPACEAVDAAVFLDPVVGLLRGR